MRKLTLATLGLLPAFLSPVAAQDSDLLRDLTVQQSAAWGAGVAHPGSLRVVAQVDRPDATYAIGETVQLTVTTNENAYITVVNIGPSGQVTQLFPNAFQNNTLVRANQPVVIPAANSAARITVSPPIGAELIKVIATSRPVTLIPESQLQGGGPFRTMEGGVAALTRNLEVVGAVAQSPADDRKIAISNVVIRTVTQHAAIASPTIVLAPAAQGAPGSASTITLPVVTSPTGMAMPQPQQPFPLLLALDKPSYRIGERIVMAVTSLQACNLTLLDVTTSGAIRVLFPNQFNQNNAIGALQTVLVAGGPSPVAMPVSGPPGTERVIALCSTDAAPFLSQKLEFGETFPAIADLNVLTRDLSVVASRPAGTTAVAVATITITP